MQQSRHTPIELRDAKTQYKQKETKIRFAHLVQYPVWDNSHRTKDYMGYSVPLPPATPQYNRSHEPGLASIRQMTDSIILGDP